MTNKALVRLITVLAPAVVLGLAASLYFPLSIYTVIPSIAVGALLGGAALLYLRLRRRLGTLTAVAAISVLSSLLFLLLAWGLPECPGTTLPVRCPAHYLGNWALIGALTPILLAALVLPVYYAVRLVLRLIGLKRSGALDTDRLRTYSDKLGLTRKRPGAERGPEAAAPRDAGASQDDPTTSGSGEVPATGASPSTPSRPGSKGRPTPKRPKKVEKRTTGRS